MTDAYEARGQDVEEEAAAERRGFARHNSRLGVVASLPPAERDVPRVECESAMIGDGDLVGVTAARREHLARVPRGGFSLDDPFAAPTTCQQVSEGWGIGERLQLAVKLSPALRTKLWQALPTQPAKQAGQHAHGKQEARTASDPTLAVWGQSAPGTTPGRWGWWRRFCPQVWRMARKPRRAPRCLGSAAMRSKGCDAAWKGGCYTTRWFCRARGARESGRVKTTWQDSTGNSSPRRSSNHCAVARDWHLGPWR